LDGKGGKEGEYRRLIEKKAWKGRVATEGASKGREKVGFEQPTKVAVGPLMLITRSVG